MNRFFLTVAAVLVAFVLTTSADACQTKRVAGGSVRLVAKVVALPLHVLANGHDRRAERRQARKAERHAESACAPSACAPATVVPDPCAPEVNDDCKTTDTIIVPPAPKPRPGCRGKRCPVC